MSAREDIARLLQQWQRLTRAESEAIQSAAWPKLHSIQARKSELCRPLNEAMEKWKSDFPQTAAKGDHPFHAEVIRLIALEAHNEQLLATRREEARAQQQHLERATQNLRKVRHSYAPPPPVAWDSYS